VIWLQTFGGLLLVVASVLVLRAVMAADAAPVARGVRRTRRRAAHEGLRRAA